MPVPRCLAALLLVALAIRAAAVPPGPATHHRSDRALVVEEDRVALVASPAPPPGIPEPARARRTGPRRGRRRDRSLALGPGSGAHRVPAEFRPHLTARWSSWAHPTWRMVDGRAVRTTTTEAVALLDAGGTFGVDVGHGWGRQGAPGTSTIPFSAGTDVEYAPLHGLPSGDWRSLVDANRDHDPVLSPQEWKQVDTGLGADDALWVTLPGAGRIHRHPPHHPEAIAGHFEWQPPSAGPGGVYYDVPAPGGQWAMSSAGEIAPAVRVDPATGDCYWLDLDDRNVLRIHRRTGGISTVLGSGPGPGPDGNAILLLYAMEDRVGAAWGDGSLADTTTGWPMGRSNPGAYAVTYRISIEVRDTSIPPSVGTRVGMFAAAPGMAMHEWYGGTYGELTIHAIPASDVEVVVSGNRVPGYDVRVAAPGSVVGTVSYPDAVTWTCTVTRTGPAPTEVSATSGTDVATVRVPPSRR